MTEVERIKSALRNWLNEYEAPIREKEMQIESLIEDKLNSEAEYAAKELVYKQLQITDVEDRLETLKHKIEILRIEIETAQNEKNKLINEFGPFISAIKAELQ